MGDSDKSIDRAALTIREMREWMSYMLLRSEYPVFNSSYDSQKENYVSELLVSKGLYRRTNSKHVWEQTDVCRKLLISHGVGSIVDAVLPLFPVPDYWVTGNTVSGYSNIGASYTDMNRIIAEMIVDLHIKQDAMDKKNDRFFGWWKQFDRRSMWMGVIGLGLSAFGLFTLFG